MKKVGELLESATKLGLEAEKLEAASWNPHFTRPMYTPRTFLGESGSLCSCNFAGVLRPASGRTNVHAILIRFRKERKPNGRNLVSNHR